MGYEANSPVKQVWLPMSIDWLETVLPSEPSFKTFADKYKEKYGIDLHDIFTLKKSIDSDYYIATGNYLVSAYSQGEPYGYDTVFVSPLAIIENDQEPRDGESNKALMAVGVMSSLINTIMGIGFKLVLTGGEGDINSIDELKVTMFEI